jgi:ketosteroid isomerase-like protein
MSDPEATVRAYYAALDEGAYDEFDELLVPGFVQRRSDRSFEGRESWGAVKGDDPPGRRPTHPRDTGVGADRGDEVAVRGRLLDADDEDLFPFIDVHRIAGDGRIERLETFTR